MHVPQAGDQEFSGGIDNAGAGRSHETFADGSDPPIGDGDRDILARGSAGRVDDRRVLEKYGLGQSGRQEGGETEQPEEQTLPTSCSASD
jgi:hypothetical protein